MTRIPSFHNMPFVHSFVIKSGSSSYIYISIYFFLFSSLLHQNKDVHSIGLFVPKPMHYT